MTVLPPLVGRVELGEELGRGAFGVVHRGSLEGGQPVAVKLHASLPSGEEGRIHREAELLAGLRHPRLVTFHGLFRGPEDQLALVYELVEGGELEDRLREGPLTLVETLAVTAGIAEGLDALHQVGLIHRDLKPGNVMLGADGSPRLIDYGMLRPTEAGQTLTATGTVMGTPSYMAPEQITGAGRPTPALDQYALGCVVYECLAGLPPFAGPLSTILDGHLKQAPPRLRERAPHLPSGLQAVLERMLAKDPCERFGSCGEAIRALDAARHHVGPASEATQVLGGSEASTATQGLAAKDLPGEVEATAPLPPPTHPTLAPPEPPGGHGLVLRVLAATLVALGLGIGFLVPQTGGSEGSTTTTTVATTTPTRDETRSIFPTPPTTHDLPRWHQISIQEDLSWTEWAAGSPGSPLHQADEKGESSTKIPTVPVPLPGHRLAVTSNRGGLAILQRDGLQLERSWRWRSLPVFEGGELSRTWVAPFLAPGRRGTQLCLNARGLGDDGPIPRTAEDIFAASGDPVCLSLPYREGSEPVSPGTTAPVMIDPHAQPPGGGWETRRRFPGEDDVRNHGARLTFEGDAWLASAEEAGNSSWVLPAAGDPRPLSTPMIDLEERAPGFKEWRQLLHVSPRLLRGRSFRAGGGWVRTLGVSVTRRRPPPEENIPQARIAGGRRWLESQPRVWQRVAGEAGFAVITGEDVSEVPESGASPHRDRARWRLPLDGGVEGSPYPFRDGFLVVHRGDLLFFPGSTLTPSGGQLPQIVPRHAATLVGHLEGTCPDDRMVRPTVQITFDPRTGLDLLVWQNFRNCLGDEPSQELIWYRDPNFGEDPALRFEGVRMAVWQFENSEDKRSYDLIASRFEISKNAGFQDAQRLPPGRLWVVGLTVIDVVNRILVLDLAEGRVLGTYMGGDIQAIDAGPVLYPGTEPGTWDIYLSDRRARLLEARLPHRTTPEP